MSLVKGRTQVELQSDEAACKAGRMGSPRSPPNHLLCLPGARQPLESPEAWDLAPLPLICIAPG